MDKRINNLLDEIKQQCLDLINSINMLHESIEEVLDSND